MRVIHCAPLLALCFAPVLQAAEPAHEHSMQDHMNDDPVRALLLADRLEWQTDGAKNGAAWDLTGWIGNDENRLWIRSEGERSDGATTASDVEALWGKPVSRWWDVLAGVRHDFAPGASRTWAALGIVGLTPYEFELQLTGYLGEHGATALKTTVEYELLLTQRWVLQPRIEATWFGDSDAARDVDSGLSKTAVGLRLRYEIKREFAPYTGVEWARHGEGRGDLNFVAGLRAWL